jgi:hypothetical protein
MWLIEAGVTIGLASASWQFIEAPILRDGFAATCRRWWSLIVEGVRRADRGRRLASVAVATVAIAAVGVSTYGIARSSAAAAPSGLLRQVAEGQRITAASQATQPANPAPVVSESAASPTPSASCSSAAAPPPKVSGRQVTAVGDSVMVASAAALEAAMPGIYINAEVDRAMVNGLAVIQGLAARGLLRHYVVVGLGTNGPVTAEQIRELRRAIGPHRELVLINTSGPMPWESEVNGVLAAAAGHDARVDLADWHRAIANRTSLLWPDEIHPRPSGAKIYARVVHAAVQAEAPRAQAPACTQPGGAPTAPGH